MSRGRDRITEWVEADWKHRQVLQSTQPVARVVLQFFERGQRVAWGFGQTVDAAVDHAFGPQHAPVSPAKLRVVGA